MRKILVLAFLGAACAVASFFPLQKSGAQKVLQQDVRTEPGVVNTRTLPDFDIRLGDAGEFVDEDVSSTSIKQQGLRSSRSLARASAVERFRAGLGAEDKHNLRAVVNDTGAMKNLFVDGGALSEPRSDFADNIARGFLKTHNELFALSSADVTSLQVTKEDNDQGTTFVDYVQTVGGYKVFEGQVQVVVNKHGQVLNVREGFLVDQQPAKLKAGLSEQKAIAAALEYSGRTVFPSFAETQSRATRGDTARFANPLDLGLEEITSELNVVRVGSESRLAWHIYAEVGPEEWYEILVDAQSGELLLRHNIYVFEAQGTVYTEAPDKGARLLVSFVGDTTINTAAGWMETSTVTTGNNVEAYLDTDANNVADPNNGSGLSNGHASAANQDFTFPFSTAVDPRTQQAAVVTNLFYYNNIMHDFSYRLGFTESARNFQVNNFGRGGLGNDSVRAEAQDGSGTNNANFATPPDGSRPRMQQFLFTSPTPDRDSSVDGDVVFHEYGHGISNRLIGNGST
ncbi:MAG TPA: M36 family metallopeptidase, partial [Pyrinomonadaceae bacterium]|nr:M36 family metallopeptidase [Pyrinomonadaceae bacterium]